MIATKDMRITKGQTWQVRLTFRDDKGAPIDLTGATVYLSATADLKLDAPLFQVQSDTTTATGTIDILDQTTYTGVALATVTAATTDDLKPYGDGDPYFWAAWAVDSTLNEWPGVATSKLSVFPAVPRS